MPLFRARVEFTFEEDELRRAGRRLRELAEAAESVGFQLESGEVEEAANDQDEPEWTFYGPGIPPQRPRWKFWQR